MTIELYRFRQDPIIIMNDLRFIKLVALKFRIRPLLCQAKTLIQYNDHTPYNVFLSLVAREIGIRTVYIQHAPWDITFLHCITTLIFFYSEDSLNKYRVIEGGDISHRRYYVAFDLRLKTNEEVYLSTEDVSNNSVLLCINKLDDLQNVLQTYNILVQKGYKVVLRRTLRIRDHSTCFLQFRLKKIYSRI